MKSRKMNFSCGIKILLLWSLNFVDGTPHSDITYQELEKLGASCNNLDNCKFQRTKDTLAFYTCHCGSFCSQLGTCCVDSPYRGKRNARFQTFCRSVYGMFNSHYFIKDRCPSGSDIWEKLCENDAREDLLSLVPVTSSSTNMTYKNYFCFRCNERTDKYRYWNIKIFSDVKADEKQTTKFMLAYNSTNHTWVAPIGEGSSAIPVTISMEVPPDIQDLPKLCVQHVISKCSKNWEDEIIYAKCNAYTSIVHFRKDRQTVSYRNPHCALCNFENLENMFCALGATTRTTTTKKPFSFTYLLDINRSDGERVGEIRQCSDDSIWDPFYSKCRTLRCAVPDHVAKNGKCTPL